MRCISSSHPPHLWRKALGAIAALCGFILIFASYFILILCGLDTHPGQQTGLISFAGHITPLLLLGVLLLHGGLREIIAVRQTSAPWLLAAMGIEAALLLFLWLFP